MSANYDIAIIGGGPGGYVGAIRASQLNKRIALIERDTVGGVCLNWGCIPSKALIHNAAMYNEIPSLEEMGLKVDVQDFQYFQVHKKSRDAAKKLTRGILGLLKKNKVDLITGTATIKTPKTVEVLDKEGNSQTVHAENIIIATGSRPRVIPGMEFDEKLVLSSTGVLSLTELPKKMIVLGGGAIGLEFAYIFSSFGVSIDLVEMLPNILPMEDAEVSRSLVSILKKKGIRFFEGTRAGELRKTGKSVELDIETAGGQKDTLEADKILVSVGRSPNSENLGLESLGIKTERGFIAVSSRYETSVPGIYAVGDIVSGTPLLAHVASKEGEIAVEHIAKHPTADLENERIPSAVYCNPQVASFGLSEERARKEGREYKVAKFPFIGVGKAVAEEKTEGFVKILCDKGTGEILGAHVLGYNATEIIHNLLTASKGELTTHELATLVHAHPTMSEAVMELARLSEGWAIHI